MNRRVTLMVAALALTLPLAGCGGDDAGEGSSPAADESAGPFQPTGTPAIQVEMMKPPGDYSEIKGEGFTISAPGEFQQQRASSNNGEPMLILEKPSKVEAFPQRVVVLRDVNPTSPAAEQSFALETAKAAPGGKDAEVERIAMPAPEGQSAFLVTWIENRPSGDGGVVPTTYWQLMHQVNDELILNVVAFAPSDEFETAEVSKILRTFVPGPA